MKVIVYEAIKYFNKNRQQSDDATIEKYIQTHTFYHQSLSISQIKKQIKQQLKKSNSFQSQSSSSSSLSLIHKQKLDQLSLYLSTQKNKYMFEIYAIVLKNSKGVTYKDIDNKVKIGIVSVSHYCCRLRKMNFVELRHEKSQKVVYPKDVATDIINESDMNNRNKAQQQQQQKTQKQGICRPFHFFELSTMDNIWVNISSYESYTKNGITNQQIKQKLNKTSQTKLIMKMVDQVREMYDLQRQMISEGKVFQNRFKNVTKQIKQIQHKIKSQKYNLFQNNSKQNQQLKYKKTKQQRKSNSSSSQNIISRQDKEINKQLMLNTQQQTKYNQKLSTNIQKWLVHKFPKYSNAPTSQKFLFNLINSQFKDYLSALGPKLARRTCTPLKLLRYIKILNSLDIRYPQTHTQLKNYLIDQEKDMPNGTMHKRSIIGILDGLIAKGVLRKELIQRQIVKDNTIKDIDSDDSDKKQSGKQKQIKKISQFYYYPQWQSYGQCIDVRNQQNKQQSARQLNKNKRKKILLASLSSQKQILNKVGIKQYKDELKTRYMCASLEQLYKSKLKKVFKNILLTRRSKTVMKMYEPETHIFAILQQQNYKTVPKIKADNYEDLVAQIDQFVQAQGIREQPIATNIQDAGSGSSGSACYEVVKLFRKYIKISQSQLKNRFGNNWWQKIEPLVQANIVKKQNDFNWVLDTSSGRYYI